MPLRLTWDALDILLQCGMVPGLWAAHLLLVPHEEYAYSSWWIGAISHLQWSCLGIQRWWCLLPEGIPDCVLLAPSGCHIKVTRWFGFLWAPYLDWELDINCWINNCLKNRFSLWAFLFTVIKIFFRLCFTVNNKWLSWACLPHCK